MQHAFFCRTVSIAIGRLQPLMACIVGHTNQWAVRADPVRCTCARAALADRTHPHLRAATSRLQDAAQGHHALSMPKHRSPAPAALQWLGRGGERHGRPAHRGFAVRSQPALSPACSTAIYDSTQQLAQHRAYASGPALEMDGPQVHILWSHTNEVHWQQVESPWLASLEPQEAQEIAAMADTKSARRARLLARRVQRAALSAGLSGAATHPQSQHQGQYQLLRNKHGKPFLRAPAHTSTAATQEPAQQGAGNAGNGDTPHGSGASCTAYSSTDTPCVWSVDLGTDLHLHPAGTSVRPTDSSQTAQCANEPCLQFNVSHTDSLVGCALAPAGIAVGLDVERRGRVPRAGVMKLARRRFAPAEVAALEACPDDQSREELFLWLWTLKEALVKARGTGISAAPGLRGFAVGVHRLPSQSSSPDTDSIGTAGVSLSGQSQVASPLPVQLSVSLTCTVPSATNNGDTDTRPCVSGGPSCAACPTYHLLLLQPSEEHIAALCIATPPTQGDASQTVDTTQPSAPPPSPESEDPSAAPFVTLGGMRVTLWRGVPDDTWHRQTLDTDSVGSDRHGTVRVLGSTAYR